MEQMRACHCEPLDKPLERLGAESNVERLGAASGVYRELVERSSGSEPRAESTVSLSNGRAARGRERSLP